MEYVGGGTLKDLINYRYNTLKVGFSDEEVSIIMKNILEAVDYMHSKGIFHRDLKPGIQNITSANILTKYCPIRKHSHRQSR